MYHNTTHLSGNDLKKAVAEAAKQDDAILLIFKNCNRSFSPSEVEDLCLKAGHKYLKTSIRRSITNLTKKDLLENTGLFVTGPHGRNEGKWIYKNSTS